MFGAILNLSRKVWHFVLAYIYEERVMKLLAFIVEHPSYYNCFTTSPGNLMKMDFPSLSESVPMVCGIYKLPASVYCKALCMLNWFVNWIFVCLAIIEKK